MTPGKLAMGTALALAAQGKRRNGRWVRKSLSQNLGIAEQEAMRRAGFILDWRPDLAPRVMALGPRGLVSGPESTMEGAPTGRGNDRQGLTSTIDLPTVRLTTMIAAEFATRDEAIGTLIVEPIESTGVVPDARTEYDIEGIASHVVEMFEGQPVTLISEYAGRWVCMCDADTFWTVVEQHAA